MALPASYADVKVPFETQFISGGNVRILAVMGESIIGVHYGNYADGDGAQREYCNQALVWLPNGHFTSDNRYPEMNLIPPPGQAAEELRQVTEQIAAIEARLNANPTAPEEWRSADERRLTALRKTAVIDLMREHDAAPAAFRDAVDQLNVA